MGRISKKDQREFEESLFNVARIYFRNYPQVCDAKTKREVDEVFESDEEVTEALKHIFGLVLRITPKMFERVGSGEVSPTDILTIIGLDELLAQVS